MKYGWGVALALAVAGTACAGDEIPPIDFELASQIAAAYGGGTATAPDAASHSAGNMPASAGAGGAGAGGPSLRPEVASGGATTDAGAMAGAAGSFASAGGGTQASPTAAGSTCDGFALLASNCGTSGCHGSGSNLGTFAASESAARSYIGKSGTVTCAGQGSLINPDDPPASILVQKLGDYPPCGNHMPLAGALLSDADVACIEDWIGSL